MDWNTICNLALKRSPGVLRDTSPSCLPPGARIGVGEIAALNASETRANYTCFSLPDWMWPHDGLPYGDGEVSMIHCYHFLEHLTGDNAILFLRHCESKLAVGGILQYGMPLAGTELAFHDLTHKSNWCADTLRIVLDNPYQPDDAPWKLKRVAQMIIGVTERNMMVCGQLQKKEI